MSGRTTRIAGDQKERSPLDREHAAAEPTHRPAEESLKTSTGTGTREREAHATGKQTPPRRRSTAFRQQPAGLLKDVVGVRPTHDESDEALNFLVRDPSALTDVLAQGADLPVDHIAEAESPRHRARGILVL